MGNEIFNQAFLAIEKIVAELGYECVNVALASEDGRPVLRVMIDSIGGINVKDCETVSRTISRFLDDPESEEAEKLGDRYYLEVSSPGLERPLFTSADYERFRGKEARIKTRELVDGRKTHIGLIAASDDMIVTLDTEQGPRDLRLDNVARATLIFKGLEAQPKKANNKQNGKRRKGEKVEKTIAQTVMDIEEEH